jgi:hypothetical protein
VDHEQHAKKTSASSTSRKHKSDGTWRNKRTTVTQEGIKRLEERGASPEFLKAARRAAKRSR